MTGRARRVRRRGIMLVEVLSAIILLAAFMIVSTQVLRTSLRAPQAGGDAAAGQARFDAALAQLRRDVWGAGKFEVIDPQTLRVERPGRPVVSWSVVEDGSLVRTLAQADAAGEQSEPMRREWPGIAKGVTFEAAGLVLTLVEPAGPSGDARRVPLVSQLALANAGRAGQ